MKLDIKTRNISLTDKVRDMVEGELGKLEKFLPEDADANVTLKGKKNYVKVDTLGRYAFEAPEYAVVTNDPFSPEEKNWINVEMPRFKASIHLTHKDVKGNLGEYLEDVHTMITKHLQKANGMNDSLIINPDRKVYGMLIEMDGKGVATPLQFYLTDSTANFVRGALYFNFVPNNDSMQPVIGYLRQDIDRMIGTFEWK